MKRSLRPKFCGFFQLSALLAGCVGLAVAAGCQREQPRKTDEAVGPIAQPEAEEIDESKPTTGRQALNQMIIAYRKASRYADAGLVHLKVESGGQQIVDETAPFSFTLDRPNKVRMHAYQAMLVCNGKKLFAAIGELPGQVVVKPAPIRVTVKTLYSDRLLAMASTQGIGGALPQVVLLLASEPMKILLRDAEEPTLSDPGKIDDRDCYRVQLKRPEGMSTWWIDQETLVLRRIVLPTDEIRRAIERQQPVDNLSLVAEFPGAQIDGKIDAKAFEFEAPSGAKIVPFFIPPHTAQLLSKRAPEFTFFDLDGKPVTPESTLGKVTVLDFWATWCGPCRESLPNLEKVHQKYKDNPKVAFYAVSVDTPKVKNKHLKKMFEDLKVTVPILRDTERSAGAMKFTGIPTMFIIGANGIVQDYESGFNPNLAEALPEKIDKVLAGENIYEKPLKEYQEQLKKYAKMIESSSEDEPALGGDPIVEERKLPEVKTAPRSEPAMMKLTPLWKCTDVKSPGNMLVLSNNGKPSSLAVVEGWKSIAEIGLDGKLIALHKLNLEDNEVIGSLRTAAGADGKRYVAAFLTTQQRCHVLDEDWKLVASYPEDALKRPHSGIADVELGDLSGDGKLKLYVSYWGIVGVQAASLEGERLWANRSIANVNGMAVGDADEKGRRKLYCANNTDSLVVLDGEGQRQGEIKTRERMLYWIVAADLRGEGQLQWCAMSSPRLAENVAVGLSLDGKQLWSYALPSGVPPQPIEPIVPGRVTREGPGQWLLPGPDGSIHVISADGKPLDKFNSGATLQGLATVEIDGQPVLLISSANGLEAWKAE